MNRNAIIVDVDGTIAHNDGHRGPFDWQKVGDDAPIVGVIEFLQYICTNIPDLEIIFVSGRMDICAKLTISWIGKHLPGIALNYQMFMRETDDYRTDQVVKEEIYRKYIEPYYNVIAVFDDRNKVVKMWRDIGLTCFQVADGDF